MPTSSIVKLPKEVADKIAAGEVVDRPVSIVKELVENALDAGSDSIIIEMKKGGKTYIRVTDNGCGIPAKEVDLAFERHATSKIRNAGDLNSIHTLGFRGEALASIAAVSRVEMITKTLEEKTGSRLLVEGGQVVENKPTGCPEGTTLVVADLFYNTPARLKFMKAEGTESTLIIDLISRMALAYPKVRFRLINNGSILFSTPGKGDTLANILTVYSKDLSSKLIYVSGKVLVEEEKIREGVDEDGRPWDMKIEGYISSVDETRSTRKNQIFFVNGRSVQSKVMENAVTAAYGDRLMERRFPVVFLFLTVDPEKVDVNIHPNKREVRFDDEKIVEAFVKAVVARGLATGESLPEIKTANPFQKAIPSGSISPVGNEKSEQVDIKNLLLCKSRDEHPSDRDGSDDRGNTSRPIGTEVGEESVAYGSKAVSPQGETSVDYGRIQPKEPVSRPFNPADIRITGAIFATYITGVDDEHFYLIDQHAAHERIFYEHLIDQYNSEEKMQQSILTPMVIHVDHTSDSRSANWLPALLRMGYDVEEFGPRSYMVKAIPVFMSLTEGEDFMRDFIDGATVEINVENTKNMDRIIMRSCKSTIKANDRLDPSEMKSLMIDLSKMRNPFSCPHGRPTIIRISRGQIERMFKRA